MYGRPLQNFFFFFFNDTATTEIYTLSLHDALPISRRPTRSRRLGCSTPTRSASACSRSEEHTSELQSQSNLVCRLLLEKKKTTKRAPAQRLRSHDPAAQRSPAVMRSPSSCHTVSCI